MVYEKKFCPHHLVFKKPTFQKEMAVARKQCIFDPMLVKPKCVREALATKCQIFTVSKLQPFTFVIFQMCHALMPDDRMENS